MQQKNLPCEKKLRENRNRRRKNHEPYRGSPLNSTVVEHDYSATTTADSLRIATAPPRKSIHRRISIPELYFRRIYRYQRENHPMIRDHVCSSLPAPNLPKPVEDGRISIFSFSFCIEQNHIEFGFQNLYRQARSNCSFSVGQP